MAKYFICSKKKNNKKHGSAHCVEALPIIGIFTCVRYWFLFSFSLCRFNSTVLLTLSLTFHLKSFPFFKEKKTRFAFPVSKKTTTKWCITVVYKMKCTTVKSIYEKN